MPIYPRAPRVPYRGMGTMRAAGSSVSQTVMMPNVPGTPSLAQGNGSDLTVIWAAPTADTTHSAAATYNLRSSPSGANSWIVVSGVVSPYDLSGLAADAAVDVQIQAGNAAGVSTWSAISTLTTAGATAGPFAPNAPAAATLTQGSGSDLMVTWAAPTVDATHSAATTYNLRFSPSGANSWTVVSGVASSHDLSGLAAGAAIDVQIQASNAAGVSTWSATSTLTTAGPLAPNAPAAATLAQGSSSDLTVTWAAPATDTTHGAATTFNLRSSPSGANTWTVHTGATSPFDLTGLTAGAPYDVQVQAQNAGGTSAWSATSTLTTATAGALAPNAPAITSIAPPPDGTNSKLTVTWTAPVVDGSHGAATGYNLRYSPSGAGTWTTVSGVSSPYTVTGLTGAAAIDVEVQATNAAASPGAWSVTTTAQTWGVTVTQGSWVPASSQVHNTNVAPNGGANMYAVPAPTAVTSAAFAWSSSATTVPASGLTAAGADGQTNGWGAYFSAPATAGTYYLWILAQGSGGSTIGALVTSAITVS